MKNKFVRLFKNIFVSSEISYYKGRMAGWFACEKLVLGRIKKFYPEIEEELKNNLLA